MSLQEQVLADLKQAMLSQDSVATSVLRMLKSEIKNAEIAQEGTEILSEEAVLKTVLKELKKRRDAAAAFRGAGHEDRALQEEQEAAILEKYLPAQAEPAAIEEFIRQQVALLEEPSAKNRGVVIKAAMAHFGAQADSKVISQIASQLLP